ncbi:Crp/Fnr family transcriptional regulator [Ulvibacter litoralis]|uniref:cAMP-binding domain of CRP or a regulatory subunit of cAMP-dependent protein kinases n=1 Tax=Ulvibacter litoralis TaxID=227084 RepID=A0A1G7F6U7_9FLAO|nr:Crp/Fnr family transcriptional regulator [Ulvibacter litoralis]GHC52446.1 hypothetical protein GCM10008083_15330 [Ulvibacter litoralis]SDE71564.1 cAMP-binding domain of CRP or a regulatory subunit of cAMP-dependent protein kinases [Ulvibacter litoralis]
MPLIVYEANHTIMIPEETLLKHQAIRVSFEENEVIFSENKRADFYFQIQTGGVKMYNLNENGKEFVQGIFYDGESFGEPPLFGDFKYPASASTISKTTLFKIGKKNFFELLKVNFDLHLHITSTLSNRLRYKSMILNEISVHPPEHRIVAFIDFLKQKEGITTKYKLDLTRQQIANLTGLRVETIIRACKQLEQDGEIEIIKHKIYR